MPRLGALSIQRKLTLGVMSAAAFAVGLTLAALRLSEAVSGGALGTVAAAAVALGASAVVGLLVASWLHAAVSQPLRDLARGAEAAAAGDLATEVAAHADDELGLVASSFNDMTRRLRGVVSEVRASILSVAEVSQTLSQGSHRVSVAASRQEGAVEAAAESIETVATSIERVNATAAELAETATETSSSMIELDASVAEIATHMDQLADRIESSTAAVVELTATIQSEAEQLERLSAATAVTEGAVRELHASVDQVEGDARRSRELALRSRGDAERGRASVQQTVAAMGEIKTGFVELESAVGRLAAKSDSIGQIVKAIEGLAEETNLLSLNAAIIASQAGDHGKAFGVVAGAVKDLADRTTRSTREIATLVAAVQTETAGAVRAVTQGADRVERGVAASREAGESLGSILDGAETSARMGDEIGAATDRQARDLAQVDRTVREVRECVEQVARSIREQAASSAEIRGAVGSIRDLGHEVKRSTQEQSRGTKLVSAAAERVADRVQEMLRATREQTKESEQIRSALHIFRQVTLEGVRTAQEMQASVDTLGSRSAELEQAIGRFRV